MKAYIIANNRTQYLVNRVYDGLEDAKYDASRYYEASRYGEHLSIYEVNIKDGTVKIIDGGDNGVNYKEICEKKDDMPAGGHKL